MIDHIASLVYKSIKFNEAVKSTKVRGLPGFLKSIFINALSSHHSSILILTYSPIEIGEDLSHFFSNTIVIPPYDDEPLPYDVLEKRVSLLFSLIRAKAISVTTDINDIEPPESFKSRIIELKKGYTIDRDELTQRLFSSNFTRTGTVYELGEFAVRGALIDVFPPILKNPVRVEFYGDEIISLREFDCFTQRSIKELSGISIPPMNILKGESELKDYIDKRTLVIFDDVQDFPAKNKIVIGDGYDIGGRNSYIGNTVLFREFAKKINDYSIYILCEDFERDTLRKVFPDLNLQISTPPINHGFILDDVKLAVFSYSDIFGEKRKLRERHPFRGRGTPIEDLTSLNPGTPVVHINYGIGIYEGIKKIIVDSIETDCLFIRYKDGDRLYVPIDKMRYVERYIGPGSREPELTRLGSGVWERKKKRAEKNAEQVTRELISLYAKRKIARGFAFSPDTVWQAELESSFPYEETEDQARVLEEIKKDMEISTPMDRLVCGEVGFGKTEVALRAAFKAILDGKQVAVLVPTTILAEQHLRTFESRLSKFPVRVEQLSRLTPSRKRGKIIKDVKDGKVDIVIGTHALLSKNIFFRDLGLLIIDEEHRFGVRQKEKIKGLKKDIDVLSLTATPIPRTLYMSLSGIRNFSSIETPPQGRLPIVTSMHQWDDELIHTIILREIERDGQVYFVHNRVESIDRIAAIIRAMDKRFRVGVAHGEMRKERLESIMLDFLHREINVLCTTAIIGSGIDIPNANTMLINRADRFGLADLHQLRGRVGRSERRAYCWLIVPRSMTKDARRRLQSILTFTELGAGFRLAMRDLEIRGAGNLLGSEQHGYARSVGYELYMKMIKEAIRRMRGEKLPQERKTELNLGMSSFIPDEYVDKDRKLGLYKRLTEMKKIDEVRDFRNELIDRFGQPSQPTKNLLLSERVRILCIERGIERIMKERNGFSIKFSEEVKPDMKKLRGSIKRFSLGFNVKDGLEVFLKSREPKDIVIFLRDFVSTMNH